MRLSGYENISSIDWYGQITTVLFFAGCNMRCRFCYNHSEVFPNSGTEVDIGEVLDIIETNSGLVDAVVVTGGEPCLQPIDLYDILVKSKSLGLRTLVDTNGSYPRIMSALIKRGVVDKVALDIKAPLAPLPYSNMCAVDRFGYIKVRDTLKLGSKVEMEVRTTVVPGTYSDPLYIPHIADSIAPYASEYHLQQFDSSDPLDIDLKGIETVPFESLEALAWSICDKHKIKVLAKSKDKVTTYAP